jgi:hypothetical protein
MLVIDGISLPTVMNVTAGRVSADSTKVRRLPGQAPIKSCARPARSDPGVDGQIHKKTAANGVRVISGHAGAGAESIISVEFLDTVRVSWG